MPAAHSDIYVTYDVSPLVKLDGTQYYMLRYENPDETKIWEEVSDLPTGIPAGTKNTVYYPYTNGKEGFNIYGDEKKDAAFNDGESTRTRYLWYFEGDDPYRVKIHSHNGNSSYHGDGLSHLSYFYTFYGKGEDKDNNDLTATVHTVLTQTDRNDHQPTEYMILNGSGSNTASFPYRLVTTAEDATTGIHLEVTTFEHQWLNPMKSQADGLSGNRTANWYHISSLETDFTKTHANHTNIWYETIDLGSDFQIEPVTLLPVLHLVDNHGWEIAHWSMENSVESKNKIKQFNSPMVKEYRWYSGESNTGLNKPIVKVSGYYKFYINPAVSGSTPVATTIDLTSDWMHVNFDDVSKNYNFYVFYDAYDDINSENSYLLELGGQLAEASGASISYDANGTDYHTNGVLKDGVTPSEAMQWVVAPNPDLDVENAYRKYSGYSADYDYSSDATSTSAGRPEPGKDASRFDPYDLRIQNLSTSNYYTVANTSYAISLTDGTATQFTYTDRADLERDNTGTTFMLVQGTDGKLRLVLRNSDRAENLTRALDRDGTATTTAATTTTGQTALLVPTHRNTYTIVRSDGTQVISAAGYTKTLQVPDEIASPLLNATFYSFYSTEEDALAKTNALTDATFATLYTNPVFVRYDEQTYTNTPVDLSGGTWYNVRLNGQFLQNEGGVATFPATAPTDAALNDDKYFWKFTGDPYTVTVTSKASTSPDLFAGTTFIWLGNATYGWHLLANMPPVDGEYNYLYNDGEGQAQLHREALGATTAADNFFIEEYGLESYTYHIINRAGTEAIRYTIGQRTVTALNYHNLPAAIRSPYIEDETLTFYSDAECTTAITTAGEATGGDIYVKYTNHLTDTRLDLKGTSNYRMRVNGTYVYDDSGALATGSTTDNWLLTGSDPYAVEVKSVTGGRSICYDTSGPSLSLSGTTKTFILLGGQSDALVELMAATGADISTTAYYSIGLDGGTLGLYSNANKAHLNNALQINFSKVAAGGVIEIAFSSDMEADLTGHYKALPGFIIDQTISNFTGEFDGDFQEISTASRPLFNDVTGATIKNVIIGTASISGGTNAGAIANSADGATRIYNCGVLGGTVSGSGNVGSIVGSIAGTTRVINCFSYADVSGATVGGIVGNNTVSGSNNGAITTMVMNCMYYANATGTTATSPIYGGNIISNAGSTGLNNYNYYAYDRFTSPITAYNCALGARDKYLNRLEFFRYILNSNRALATWYVTGSEDDYASVIATWVLETADRSISNPKPYPVLRRHGKYPSIVNIDAAHAEAADDVEGVDRNKGYKLGTLNVSISLGSGAPSGAKITTSVKYLNITDKDAGRYNFNYRKVQLPYYNEVGTGNYTNNKVVTGWKITGISGGTQGTFETFSGTEMKNINESDGHIYYNWADRTTYAKDLYSVSGRVFNQGAYFNVPDGVTAITIEPYWGKAAYLSDSYYDATYNSTTTGNSDKHNVTAARYTGGSSYPINGSSQIVYTDIVSARNALGRSADGTVYDYAVVLVGNYHHYFNGDSPTGNNYNNNNSGADLPVTFMSADLDGDNEPDNVFFIQNGNTRIGISPVRFDFLPLIPLGMAQKPNGMSKVPEMGVIWPYGWFEVTNTSLLRMTNFEYATTKKVVSPLILEGGIIEVSFTSFQGNEAGSTPNRTNYIRLGGNVYIPEFSNGSHVNNAQFTAHIPISVTGGDFESFYLTGMQMPKNGGNPTKGVDDAECYIDGGRFGELAGTGMRPLGNSDSSPNSGGNVVWRIFNADIDNFYGGGINAAYPLTGNIEIHMRDSHVGVFCGGPKFGDMASGKTVVSDINGCSFTTFFGAGYGGTSVYKTPSQNDNVTGTTFPDGLITARGTYNASYNKGIATSNELLFFQFSGGNVDNKRVAQVYTHYASVSKATTHNVTSTLTGCKIAEDFYGGGNLGLVDGNVISTLTNCEVGGSVFGAGFSAAVPTVDVFTSLTPVTYPAYDANAGVFTDPVYQDAQTYTWKNDGTAPSASHNLDDTYRWIFTDVNLTEFGKVTGDVTLIIKGDSNVAGNVFGGGNQGEVSGSTTVNIQE